jgi:hypothetical protein
MRTSDELPPDWSVRASRGLRLDISPTTALGLARRALKDLPLLEEAEMRDGLLVATTTRYAISVAARPSDRCTIVTVESHPPKPKMFDRGKSQALVDAVVDSLTMSQRRPAVAPAVR